MDQFQHQKWQKAVDHVKTNREGLKKALAAYEDHPQLMRNHIAELGMELTPNELNELATTLELMMEYIDNE